MDKYKVGDIALGVVTGIEDYGAFVSLEDGYNGLIHISEISYDFVKNISDFVTIGENIKAKVVEIDDKEKQIKLSIKDMNFNKNKKSKSKIHEVGSKFEILHDNLDNWIDIKKKEISKEKEEKY